MKTLVTYFTQTGTTQKVAESIFEAVDGDKEIKHMDEVDSLGAYDLTFVGFPMHAGGAAQAAKDFLAGKAQGQRVALFVLHASFDDGPGVAEAIEKCREAAAGTELAGLFHCRGELSEQIAEFMINSGRPELAEWGKRRSETVGFPDEKCLEGARAFARQMTA